MTFSILFVFSSYPATLQAPKQIRHPERSASQIYRKQRAWWRAVEGPRRCLSSRYHSHPFNHRSAHLADPLRSFPEAEKTTYHREKSCSRAWVFEKLRTTSTREASPGSFDSAP